MHKPVEGAHTAHSEAKPTPSFWMKVLAPVAFAVILGALLSIYVFGIYVLLLPGVLPVLLSLVLLIILGSLALGFLKWSWRAGGAIGLILALILLFLMLR